MADVFNQRSCDDRHTHELHENDRHDKGIESLHGRINALYVTLLLMAVGAASTLIMFILGKIPKAGG